MINKKKLSLIIFWLLALSLCSVLFSFFISSLTLFFSVILSLFLFEKRKFSKKNIKLFLIISVPFWLTLVSLFFSYDVQNATSILVKRLPILLVPFVGILVFEYIQKKDIISFFWALLIGFSLVNFYGLVKGFVFYLEKNSFFDSKYLFYIYPAQHVYLATYITFTLVSSIFLYSKIKTQFKTIFIFLNCVLILSFIFLSSKMALITLILSLVLIFFSKFSIRNTIFFSIILFFLVVLMLVIFDPFFDRIKTLALGLDPRVIIWDCVLEKIRINNYLYFIPIGDYQKHLDYCYYQKGFKFSLDGYNTHNQFLEIWLTNGLLGLIIYMSSLFSLFKYSINSKKVIMSYFLIIITLFNFTETIFQRQYGIMFYSILITVFVFSPLESSK
ncbi:O-antigen ligase family protein [Confluentibacter sediminis]|uniref:O-antigen ligase family protein n=1 Tax=Confluentibacter sediminis TaxID=2219045 RepID=UPI000DABE0AA|nr:O-antigen ligase family protein [Confluentibacter sediminis]